MDGSTLSASEPKAGKLRSAVIAYRDTDVALIDLSVRILSAEFSFVVSQNRVRSIDNGPIAVADDLLKIARDQIVDQTTDLSILFTTSRITTAFGKWIVGQSDDRLIVVSSARLTLKGLPRLLRHELGHYFGLREHLGCVMSPCYVEDADYCQNCVREFVKMGVQWAKIFE